MVGTGTTDLDGGKSAEVAAGTDGNTCSCTLESVADGGDVALLEAFLVHNRHGAGKVGLLDGTVTDDYGLFEHFHVFCEGDVNDAASRYGNRL